MQSSTVFTNDQGNRNSFKDALANKVNITLASKSEEQPVQILLLPTNYQELSENELLFTLTNNPELKHSVESATLTASLLYGRLTRPTGVDTQFKVIEVVNPTPLPEFAIEKLVQKKVSTVAPGFARTPDSSIERLTIDQNKRAQFKKNLADKVTVAKQLPVAKETSTKVLLLPSNYKELSEAELQFTLVNNSELKHSVESATLTVGILYGKTVLPEKGELKFRTIELANPVPLPDLVKEILAPRKPSTVAPGFSRTKDSSIERRGKEDEKRAQFKQSLADKLQLSLTERPAIKETPSKVFLIPANYKELSEADLHFALVNNPELKHSHDSALLTVDILRRGVAQGSVKFRVQHLQEAKTGSQPIKLPTKAPPVVKRLARDVSGTKWLETITLPENYRELSEGELRFVLLHDASLKYTPEYADVILDVLFSRREIPTPFVTEQYEVEMETKVPSLDANVPVLLLPSNYREFSGPELHSALVNTSELNHTEESALLVMRILQGGERPVNTILQTVDIIVPRMMLNSAPKKPVKKSDRTTLAKDITSNQKEGVIETLITLPENYLELSEAALHHVFTYDKEFKKSPELTDFVLDILFDRVVHPNTVKFEIVKSEFVNAVRQSPKQTSRLVSDPEVLLVPINHQNYSAPELYNILINTLKLGHTEKTAQLAMSLLIGGKVPPGNVALQAVEL